MSEALEIILRYIVAAGCGWLVQHGINETFASPDFVSAVSTVIGGVLLWAAMVGRALVMSTVTKMVERLRSRHRVALLDGAASVPGVTKIEATQELALATDSPKVVAS